MESHRETGNSDVSPLSGISGCVRASLVLFVAISAFIGLSAQSATGRPAILMSPPCLESQDCVRASLVLFVAISAQPHEGSCYSATKELQMAMHRSEHVKSRLAELDKLKQDHLGLKQQQQPPGSARSYPAPVPEQPR